MMVTSSSGPFAGMVAWSVMKIGNLAAESEKYTTVLAPVGGRVDPGE